jgi:hypothetical protein
MKLTVLDSIIKPMGYAPPLRAVSVVNKQNRSRKLDGDEFLREATGFNRSHNGTIIPIPAHLAAKQRRMSLNLLMMADAEANGRIGMLGIFCHGWTTGLQTGHSLDSAIELAGTLHAVCTPDVRIFAAACSAGVRFLPQLHELMGNLGMSPTIWGHTTAGHTTRNPNLIRIYPDGEPELLDGEYRKIVKSALDKSPTFRFRIPLADSMSQLVDWAEAEG